MHLNLSKDFTAAQRPYSRGTIRHNAPKMIVAKTGWLASLLAYLGL